MNTAPVRRAPFAVRTPHKQCVKCGKLVSRDAFACRRCGKRQRIRPRTMLLVAAGCLLVGMFAVASASALLTPSRSHDVSADVPAAAMDESGVVPGVPPVTI